MSCGKGEVRKTDKFFNEQVEKTLKFLRQDISGSSTHVKHNSQNLLTPT